MIDRTSLRTRTADLCSQAGFTLVELALTSFLIAVGLLGVYALLRTGMESGVAQERDVRGALFAESAFATLDAAADEAAEYGRTNWVEFLECFFLNATTNLPLPGATQKDWESEQPDYTHSFSEAKPTRLLWGLGRHAYSFEWEMSDETSVSNLVWYEFGDPNWIEDTENPYAVSVSLHVWPESPSSSAQTFFRVFSCRQGPESPAPVPEN